MFSLAGNSSWRSVSSVYGKIDTLLLTYPGGAGEVTFDMVKKRYGPMFLAFGDRVKFVILVNLKFDGGKNKFRRLAREARESFEGALRDSHLVPHHHVICVPSPLSFSNLKARKLKISPKYNHSEWAQDAFAVLNRPDGTTALLEPIYQLHSFNAMVAEQVASATGILIKPTRLHLEGGNLLVGDDYAFVGRNLLERNRLEISHEKGGRPVMDREVISLMKKELGVHYLYFIGQRKEISFVVDVPQGKEKFQPVFHLDLFLTLGCKNAEGAEVVFLAEVREEFIFDQDQDRKTKFLQEFRAALNKIARQFKKDFPKLPGPRFELKRFPLPIQIDDKGKAILYSYNNSQVEWFMGIKRMYLPCYRPPDLDNGPFIKAEKEIKNTLDGLGFQSTFVDNAFDRYVERNGSLRCLTKVLKRTYFN
ncbi:MAG: hypothetical protein H6581_21345 [Bacteroidia bacterium]|nr:hypothetical protein [Bacteroidia bacterium]